MDEKMDYLEIAAVAMMNRNFTSKDKYHLCFFRGDIYCAGRKHTHEPHHIFQDFTASELEKGLTSSQWNELDRKLKLFFKDLPICQKQLTLSLSQKATSFSDSSKSKEVQPSNSDVQSETD